ncbi:MAG: NEW3 domain-containing protein [Oscillochloridaceae bacterium]|nr:NEW3 domain-containing protein [Chloroflexaceae bacterium]MDW8391538.1 NEW3 domain-containing protein [Oscillochloridaceae bacterium]
MPNLARRCSFVLLLALLVAALPAPRAVLAQSSLVVTSSADTDDGGPTCGATDCTLRKAIRLANSTPGPNTITFASGVTTIQPQTQPLPPLTDNGTTIDGGGSRVTISGVVLAANNVSGHGLNIVSNNNTIRGLVLVGFPAGGGAATSGSGIYIDGSLNGGDNNRVYNCYLGVEADGVTANGNGRYGVAMANGASNNIIGGTGANERNIIAANRVANVVVANTGEIALNENNQIIGNYIGTNAAGTAQPTNVNTSTTEAGISVSVGARGTLIADNLVGGHTSTAPGNPIIAGITVSSFETTFNSALTPRDTTIVRNLIGVNSAGTAIPNRVGILIGALPNPNYGPYNTVIGDPLDPAGGRNVIAGNANRGIEIAESTQKYGNVTIAGNYIGLNASGAALGNGAEGIFVGRYNAAAVGDNPVVTIGPANVISANALYGVRFRSGGHVVRGNVFGANPEGSSSTLSNPPVASDTANRAPNIWIENGNNIRIGGSGIADRNIIAWSGSAAGGVGAGILIDPEASGSLNNCSGPCATGGHTIENNFIGVRRDGNGALNASTPISREGIRVRRSASNTIRDNVISGLEIGIRLGGSAAGQEASNNTIVGNRIGTRASGSLASGTGIGNRREGLWLVSGLNNTVQNNLIAFNGSMSAPFSGYHGIRVDASNNQIVSNQMAFNGALGAGDGVRVDAATAVRISRTTTTQSSGDGIALSGGGNGGQAPPTLTGVTAGSPPVLTGTACPNCTVEVFTSSVAEDREGPLFLTSGTADASGNFSIPIPGCLRYLTATATTPGSNTSPFTTALDSGALGPCTTPPTFSLGAASPSSRNVNIGSSTIFTHTLTHNAPVERTYVIQITSSLGWASGPTTVTVPAAPPGGQSSVEFGVTVGVPLGTAPNTTHSVTVRAIFGATSSNEVTDTVTAVQPTVQPATPEVTPMTQTLPLSGASVTFTHTVRNIGDLPGNFEVVGLNFVGAPPAGWTIGSVTLSPANLPAGGTATLTIVVNTPGPTPPPGEVRVRFRVGVVGTERRTDPVDDVISVPTIRSFTFLPADNPLIRTVPAGADAIFEYTLTNTGNAPDSFMVTPTLPGGSPLQVQGVSATPPLTALAAGAASTVRVTIRVPSGTLQGNYDFTVTAAASGGSSPPPAVTRNARVVVTGGGAARIDPGPGAPDPVDVRNAPGTVTFVNTVTNTGNAPVPIIVPSTFTGPAGWTVSTTATTCNTIIAAGGTCAFTVQVSVPQGVDAGAYPIQISATADNSAQAPPVGNFTATATITVNVQRFRGVELAPNREGEGAPGAVLTFTHTLTNTGNAADSFDLSVSSSEPGWTVAVSPTAALNVPRNGTRTITVQAAIPAGLGAGASTTITVTATGREGGPSASATDVARVASITAADLSPGQRRNLNPGESVTYTHTVTNTGTTTTAFIIETSDSAAGWSSTVTGSPTPVLGPGQRATITVQVNAPASAAPGEQNTTRVRVRAVGAGTPVLDETEDITAIGPARGVIIEPNRSGQGPPNSTVVFTHTVRNIGSEQGLFRLTVAEANGWPAIVAPDLVNLGPGQEIEVTVRVFIPDGKRAGDPGFARVRVELVGDPSIFDEAEDSLTVSRVAGVSLAASQVRLVQPGGRPQTLSGLAVTNRGSAADVFDLAPIGLPAGWSLTITPSTVPVDREGTFRVGMQVTVPASVAPGTITRFFVEARSRFDSAARDRVEVTLVVPEASTVPEVRPRIYLPLVRAAQ